MAQVWECVEGCGSTQDPKVAGDHERANNGGLLWEDAPKETRSHFMDDIGE